MAIGPTPYGLAMEGDFEVPRSVRAVENESIDFCLRDAHGACQESAGEKRLPKTIADCKVHTSSMDPFLLLRTDCPASRRASGSAVFSGDLEHPRILGIIYGGPQLSDLEFQRERTLGEPIVRPYSDDDNFTFVYPVRGALEDAIYKAANFGRSK